VPRFAVDMAAARGHADGWRCSGSTSTWTACRCCAASHRAGIPLDGVVTGRVALTGTPDGAPLALDVRLELGLGVAIVPERWT
jgi:hypothetical protein